MLRFIRWIFDFLMGLFQFTLYSALFFILVGGASYWVAMEYFSGKEVEAPDLAGQSLRQALELLKTEEIGLVLEGSRSHIDIPEGMIVSQFPNPGTTIKAGTSIRVVISEGSPLVQVPDLRGSGRIEAGIRLRKLGLELGEEAVIERDGAVGGAVLMTDPPPGAGAPEGTRVNLLVAAGRFGIARQMPNLIGLTPEEARQVLEAYGLGLSEERGESDPDETMPAGQIWTQSPAPGDTVKSDTAITVIYQPEREAVAPDVGEDWNPSFYRGGEEEAQRELPPAYIEDREDRADRSRLPELR